MKRSHVLVAAGVVLAAAVAFGREALGARHEDATDYRTARVERTDLVATITASGTVVPEEVVDVGAQVNGRIASFGTDAEARPIDYRSQVTKDMVLARIDTSLFDADVATAEAQVAQAQAQVAMAEASRDQAAAHRDQARRDQERAQKLEGTPALAQADFDAAQATFEGAEASVTMAEAAIVQARAQVRTAQAALTRARRNLDYCTIRSPVDGVILDRRVDIGQTVVASLNAPSLFLIAKDLRRMTVLVQVNEADVAHVRPGDAVTFTVDAHPDAVYHGTVRKVRLNATLTQNVVTYTVEVSAENPGLELLPYLTAEVVFETARGTGVLAVPSAALRWSPRSSEPAGARVETARGPAESALWVLRDGVPERVAVHAGIGDGTRTAVEGEGLSEGELVVVGERSADQASPASGTNPFAPQMLRGRSR